MFQPKGFSLVRDDEDAIVWKRTERVTTGIVVQHQTIHGDEVLREIALETEEIKTIDFTLTLWRDTNTYRFVATTDLKAKLLFNSSLSENDGDAQVSRAMKKVYKEMFAGLIDGDT